MGRIRYKCFLQSKKSAREKRGGIWPIFIAIPNLQKGERVLLEHCASIAQTYTTFYPFQIKGASGRLDRPMRRVISVIFQMKFKVLCHLILKIYLIPHKTSPKKSQLPWVRCCAIIL
jgi:hypothetical protein